MRRIIVAFLIAAGALAVKSEGLINAAVARAGLRGAATPSSD